MPACDRKLAVCPSYGKNFRNLHFPGKPGRYVQSKRDHRWQIAPCHLAVKHLPLNLENLVESVGACDVESWATDLEIKYVFPRLSLAATNRAARQFHHRDVLECSRVLLHGHIAPPRTVRQCGHQWLKSQVGLESLPSSKCGLPSHCRNQ